MTSETTDEQIKLIHQSYKESSARLLNDEYPDPRDEYIVKQYTVYLSITKRMAELYHLKDIEDTRKAIDSEKEAKVEK